MSSRLTYAEAIVKAEIAKSKLREATENVDNLTNLWALAAAGGARVVGYASDWEGDEIPCAYWDKLNWAVHEEQMRYTRWRIADMALAVTRAWHDHPKEKP